MHDYIYYSSHVSRPAEQLPGPDRGAGGGSSKSGRRGSVVVNVVVASRGVCGGARRLNCGSAPAASAAATAAHRVPDRGGDADDADGGPPGVLPRRCRIVVVSPAALAVPDRGRCRRSDLKRGIAAAIAALISRASAASPDRGLSAALSPATAPIGYRVSASDGDPDNLGGGIVPQLAPAHLVHRGRRLQRHAHERAGLHSGVGVANSLSGMGNLCSIYAYNSVT